jgi:hypothetical protein
MKANTGEFGFISERIRKLHTGVFYAFDTSVLKFPNTIITVIDADESGKVWFLLRSPYEDIGGLDRSFYAELTFFNKHYNYFITVTGVVEIVDQEMSLREFRGSAGMGREVLLMCLSVASAAYHESRDHSQYALPLVSDIKDHLSHFAGNAADFLFKRTFRKNVQSGHALTNHVHFIH